jgi:hypothetical protein
LVLGDKMQVDRREGVEDGDGDGDDDESEEGGGSWDEEEDEDEDNEEGGGDNDYEYENGQDAAFDENGENELRYETWNKRFKEPFYEEDEEECY